MFSYKVVERALARRHQIAADNFGAFRGRIQHLQRLGMVPASPGRGKRIVYTLEDAAKWAFALELEEFGIDPSAVKTLVDRGWDRVRGVIVDGDGRDALLLLSPNLISQRGDLGIFNFSVMESSDYEKVVRVAQDPQRAGPIRVLVLNLSWIAKDLRSCLKAASHPDDNYPGAPTVYIDDASLGLTDPSA